MNGTIFTAVAALGTTSAWLVNRWVIRGGGRGHAYGFWSTLSAAVIAGILIFATGQAQFPPAFWWISAMIAVAYGVGYFVVIMHCVNIGPTGPTMAMNNTSIVWPVVLSALWLKPHRLSSTTAAGLAIVAVALVLFGVSKRGSEESHGISARWLLLALLGWLFGGMSATGQYLGGLYFPTQPLLVVFGMNLLTALILAPLAFRKGKKPQAKLEFVGGVINGAIVVVTLGAMLSAFRSFGPELVFPFAQAFPILLVTLIGWVAYKEKLNATAWIAVASGAIGLVLVSLGQKG